MDIKILIMRNLFKHPTIGLVAIYIAIRLVSFLSVKYPLANSVIAMLLILGFLVLNIKNIRAAWFVLLCEILLGGSGHFFQFAGFILRTWFLGIFAIFWLWHCIKNRHWPQINSPTLIALGVFLTFVIVATSRGFLFHHSPTLVIQDTILYTFILLLFPAMEYKNLHTLLSVVRAYIIGTTIFSAITLLLYTTGISTIQDTYYHWFRDVAGGKITELGYNFFRIVLPEHLLIIPIAVIIISQLTYSIKNKVLWAYLFLTFFILSVNSTRIYIIAFFLSQMVFFTKKFWKNHLRLAGISTVCFLLIFISVHTLVSRGKSSGLELIGLRASGITTPSSDVSGAIRLALLPDILHSIKKHPWLGSGLSTTVTFVNPVTNSQETRTQFDWGYLEMITELGILGTVSYLVLLSVILYNLTKRRHQQWTQGRGLAAGLVALGIINLTTPALFQGFGVVFIVYCIVWYHSVNSNADSKSENVFV
jgi:O-antigen ligase